MGSDSIVIVLAGDNQSFFAFVQPQGEKLLLESDTLSGKYAKFTFDGKGVDTSLTLQKIHAFQEFWHSWQTFQPQTTRY